MSTERKTVRFKCVSGCAAGPCIAEVQDGIQPYRCLNFEGRDSDWVPLTDDNRQLEETDTPVVAEEAVEEQNTESPEQTSQTSEPAYEVFHEENPDEVAEDKPTEEQPQPQAAEPESTETVVDKPTYEEFRGYFIPRVLSKERLDARIKKLGMDFVRVPGCCTSVGISCDGLDCNLCLFSNRHHAPELLLARHQWMLENGYINEPVSEVSQESTAERVSDPVVRNNDDLDRLAALVEDIFRELGQNATNFDRYRALIARDLDKEALCAWIVLAAKEV